MNIFNNNIWLEYSFMALIGLLFGSFLNVLISRIPEHISMNGRSQCPKCHNTIKWFHNIPLLSWIYLKGKCAYCGNSISIIYPFIEFITMIITLIVWKYFGLSFQDILLNYLTIITTISLFIIVYSFIVLAMIDAKYQVIPDVVSIPTLWIALFFAYLQFNMIGVTNIVLLIGGSIIFKYSIDFLFNKEMFGEGDIIIFGIMLPLLNNNFYNFFKVIYLSAILVLIHFVIIKITKSHKNIFPFIPYLGTGTILFMVYSFIK